VDPFVAAVEVTTSGLLLTLKPVLAMEPVIGIPVEMTASCVPTALATATVEPPVAAVERMEENDPVTGIPVEITAIWVPMALTIAVVEPAVAAVENDTGAPVDVTGWIV
jgi:hypothetical protein